MCRTQLVAVAGSTGSKTGNRYAITALPVPIRPFDCAVFCANTLNNPRCPRWPAVRRQRQFGFSGGVELRCSRPPVPAAVACAGRSNVGPRPEVAPGCPPMRPWTHLLRGWKGRLTRPAPVMDRHLDQAPCRCRTSAASSVAQTIAVLRAMARTSPVPRQTRHGFSFVDVGAGRSSVFPCVKKSCAFPLGPGGSRQV